MAKPDTRRTGRHHRLAAHTATPRWQLRARPGRRVDDHGQHLAGAQRRRHRFSQRRNHRHTSGRWASDLAMTALVFEAVQPYTGSDPAIAASVHGYLAGAQDPDGSWAGDPYVPALARRARHAAGQTPLNPTQAGIRLQFVDARTGIAIPGVTLSGTGPSAIDASTDRSGQI